MHSLLNQSHLVSSPIEEGDAGIVLKPDGSFKIFSTGVIDPTNLTPAQLEQGKILIAFSVALQHPEIMEVLHQVANDRRLNGEKVLDIRLNG